MTTTLTNTSPMMVDILNPVWKKESSLLHFTFDQTNLFGSPPPRSRACSRRLSPHLLRQPEIFTTSPITAAAIFRDLTFGCKITTNRFECDKPDFSEILQFRDLLLQLPPLLCGLRSNFPGFPLISDLRWGSMSTVQSTVPCAATRCAEPMLHPQRQVYRVKYVTDQIAAKWKSLNKLTV